VTQENPSGSRSAIGFEPHEYQLRAIQLMAEQPAAALLLDPG
jgi:hypothetical protein